VVYNQRQVGKVSDLALGFGGGIGAYASMAKTYGVDLETLPPHVLPNATQDELNGQYGAYALANRYIKMNPGVMSFDAAVACDVIKRKWRADHPNIVASWKAYENAARSAVENPGEIFKAGRVKYMVNENFLKCLLPSGRIMHYYSPKISGHPTDWDEESTSISYLGLKVDKDSGKTTRQWTKLFTYGGKLCENIVQAFCRDLLAYAMLRIDPHFPIVFHVHDEAVAEVPEGTGNLDRFNELLTILPPWAAGMPIRAEGWVGKRYRK
jgi:DNA polymerase